MTKVKLLAGLVVVLITAIIAFYGYAGNANTFTNEAGCKCHANGVAYSPGANLCLGGFKARCIAQTGVGDSAKNCGWDYLLDGNRNKIPCK